MLAKIRWWLGARLSRQLIAALAVSVLLIGAREPRRHPRARGIERRQELAGELAPPVALHEHGGGIDGGDDGGFGMTRLDENFARLVAAPGARPLITSARKRLCSVR